MKQHAIDLTTRASRPAAMAMPDPSCPILLEAREVLDKAKDLHRAIRKIRRSSQRCLTCPGKATCPTSRYFTEAMDIAIRELRQEWGLDEDSSE
jgi:hypothetical protein